MVIIMDEEEIALAWWFPDDKTIGVKELNFDDPNAAANVEHGEDSSPHDISVDPPVVLTYTADGSVGATTPSNGHASWLIVI